MQEFPHTFDMNFRGVGGPLEIAIPRTSYKTDKMFLDTLEKKGVKLIQDPYGGDVCPTHALDFFNPCKIADFLFPGCRPW